MNYLKKYWWIILVIVLIIIFIFLLPVLHTITTKRTLGGGLKEQCFAYKQVLVANDEYPESINREYIELAIDNDGLVSGIHSISSPRFSIEKRSEIVGVTDGEFINVIASIQEEGNSIERQELYKISGDHLYVGYQTVDVPQYQDDNGVYFYEDLNHIQFESSDFFLTRVECENNN